MSLLDVSEYSEVVQGIAEKLNMTNNKPEPVLKRNWELFALILEHLENGYCDGWIDGYEREVLSHHLCILEDVELIVCESYRSNYAEPDDVYRLTMKGHDLLDSARHFWHVFPNDTKGTSLKVAYTSMFYSKRGEFKL